MLKYNRTVAIIITIKHIKSFLFFTLIDSINSSTITAVEKINTAMIKLEIIFIFFTPKKVRGWLPPPSNFYFSFFTKKISSLVIACKSLSPFSLVSSNEQSSFVYPGLM